MKPLRLEVEGLTSFAARTVIDFTDLHLFAITGPTGAGKSSLLDAMLLALFGKIPRVEREHKQLVSHGSDQLRVCLDFAVGDQRYRIARRIKTSGASEVRLDRLIDGGTDSLAGKAREAEAEIERLLGIGYDAFTRAVVLPQGQFDSFLKGDKKERRGILADLLRLDRYERMAKLAGDRQRELKARLDAHDERLRTELATATEAQREQLRAEAAAAEAVLQRCAAHVQTLGALLPTALQLRQARTTAQQAQQTADAAEQELANGRATLASRRSELDALAARRGKLEAQLREASGDPEQAARLASAVATATQLQRALASLPLLQEDAKRAAAAVTQLRDELARADAAMPQLQAMVRERAAELAAAKQALEQAQQQHAAAHLRSGLQPGDACPVCAQPVGSLPPAPTATIADARDALDTATADHKHAEKARDDADRARKQAQKQLPELQRLEAAATQRLSSGDELIAGLRSELAALAVPLPEPLDAQALVRSLQAESTRLAQAQQQRQGLATELERLEPRLSELQAQIAALTGRAELLQPQRDQQLARAAEARAQIAAATAALTTVAPPLTAPRAARDADEHDQLTTRQQQANSEAATANRRAGELAAQLRQLDERIELAARLRAERERLASDTALAASLALMLRADRFQDYVQEEALALLTVDGSARLRALSQGRYSLKNDGNDFVVVDHWNADRERSVRTLSGGETFLASLALSLALAERITALGSGTALECLFLDEGFGALDRDSLDAAVDALEALQGGSRMVGVITHVEAMAERLPARLRVVNEGGRASVRIE